MGRILMRFDKVGLAERQIDEVVAFDRTPAEEQLAARSRLAEAAESR